MGQCPNDLHRDLFSLGYPWRIQLSHTLTTTAPSCSCTLVQFLGCCQCAVWEIICCYFDTYSEPLHMLNCPYIIVSSSMISRKSCVDNRLVFLKFTYVYNIQTLFCLSVLCMFYFILTYLNPDMQWEFDINSTRTPCSICTKNIVTSSGPVKGPQCSGFSLKENCIGEESSLSFQEIATWTIPSVGWMVSL